MNRKQLINLIGAGIMSGLILASALLLNGQEETNALGSIAPDAVVSTIQVEAMPDNDVQAMEQTIIELQAREAEYQAQLEAAQTYINEQTAANEAAAYGQGEENEEEEEAYEEEEYEDEHEEEEDDD